MSAYPSMDKLQGVKRYSFHNDAGNGWGNKQVYVYQGHVIKVSSDAIGSGNSQHFYRQVPGYNHCLIEAEPWNHVDNRLEPFDLSEWTTDGWYVVDARGKFVAA